ncbi:MAG: prepilin-type N-terminal cleavage/methylation domain-containing protein [Gallionella sp.]|nr:prepilin-type N-terminal cleavage/methylation domain-containing protein [Gallionella sp.]
MGFVTRQPRISKSGMPDPASCILHPESCILHPANGFTLVELLVVLVVIGITLGITMVQLMPDKREVLRQEALRLALLLENAALEAQAGGRTLGWSGEASHYRFWRKNDYNEWVRIEDDNLFRPRELPDGIRVGQVTVEGLAIKPGDRISLSAYTFSQPYQIRLGNEYGNASITGKSTVDVSASLDGEADGASK